MEAVLLICWVAVIYGSYKAVVVALKKIDEL